MYLAILPHLATTFHIDVELCHASRVVLALVGFALFADAQGCAGDGGDGSDCEKAYDHFDSCLYWGV